MDSNLPERPQPSSEWLHETLSSPLPNFSGKYILRRTGEIGVIVFGPIPDEVVRAARSIDDAFDFPTQWVDENQMSLDDE